MPAFLYRLERKFGKYAIKRLIYIIVIGNVAVFAVNFIFADFRLSDYLYLNPALVRQGQLWRLFTFVFVPSSNSPLSVLLELYFLYIIGSSLEFVWGSFRLNFYYFLSVIAIDVAAMITGGVGQAMYIDLTLFLAFAQLAGENMVRLFFLIPVKVKWLGWLAWLYIAYSFVAARGVVGKLMVLVPLAAFFVFFGGTIVRNVRGMGKAVAGKSSFAVKRGTPKKHMHKCTVCGITELDAPEMEFRYCSQCAGDHEYCMDHLRNHEHIK